MYNYICIVSPVSYTGKSAGRASDATLCKRACGPRFASRRWLLFRDSNLGLARSVHGDLNGVAPIQTGSGGEGSHPEGRGHTVAI